MNFQLRDYQQECLSAIEFDLQQGHQDLLVLMATGLGKTEVIIEFIRNHIDWKKEERCLIVAQDVGLVYQMYNRILQRIPELKNRVVGPRCVPAIGLEMSKHVDSSARILVATRQTLAQNDGARLKEVLKHGDFKVWIIDEADLSITMEYELIHALLLAENPNMVCLGFTATGERPDGLALGIRFKKISYEKDIKRGIMEGWLKEIIPYSIQANLPRDGLSSAYDVQNWMDVHYDKWKEFGGESRHTIHFLPDILMGRMYTRFMQENGHAAVHFDSYECIDLEGRNHKDAGKTYWEHRRRVNEQLQNEAIYATNQNILSRGYDWRKCNMLLFSGNSQEATFTQRVGRGTRLPPGVFNMLYLPSQKAWRIQWNDGKEERVAEDKMPFYTETILLDFSGSDTLVSTVGTLYGTKYFIEEKKKKEESVPLIPLQMSFEQPKAVAAEVITTKRKLWRNMPTNWYQDVQGDLSTSFGADVPYMVYISAPQMAFARKLYGDIQLLTPQMSDENDLHLKLKNMQTIFNIVSRWTIWTVSGYKATWGSTVWEHFTPCHIFYPEVRSQYSTLEFASNGAAMLINQMIDYLTEKGHKIDVQQLRNFRRSSNPVTDKQIKRIYQLTHTNLPNAGWKNPVIEPPQNLTEAAQAINHFSAKAKLIKYLKDLAQGNVFLNWE